MTTYFSIIRGLFICLTPFIPPLPDMDIYSYQEGEDIKRGADAPLRYSLISIWSGGYELGKLSKVSFCELFREFRLPSRLKVE